MNTRTHVFRPTIRLGLVLTLTVMSTACAWSNKARGTAVGTTTGAAVGGVIGNQTGSTARGAIIGAVVGGAAGAIIGSRMDQQARELEAAIPGAEVERVGEGVVVTFASGLLYNFDSDAILAEAGRNLRELAASLARYPDTDILVVGHTDAVGSAQYNQDLSTRRADSAYRYLLNQGVAGRRMQTSGKGETEPVATNGTEAGRQLNRRIEVAIFAGPTARTGSR
jgi:outer membrane protein OmpA-like peptidoglycan-associated protein